MGVLSRLKSFSANLRKFVAADRGNVVITFALATVPIVGFVGAAVDYSRANSDKAAMQAAVDATALMLSKTASTPYNGTDHRPRPPPISTRYSIAPT